MTIDAYGRQASGARKASTIEKAQSNSRQRHNCKFLFRAVLACLFLSSSGLIAQPDFSLYKQRRQAVLAMLGSKSIAIYKAAPEVNRNGDVDYEYRQDSDFFYLTGFTEPEAILVLSPAGIYVRDESKFVHELLFLRERNPQREIWNGYRLGVAGAKTMLGLEASQPIEVFENYLPAILRNLDTLYIKTTTVGFDAPLTPEMEFIRKAHERLYDFKIGDAGKLLVSMRQKKDARELLLLRSAIDITCEAHNEAMRKAAPEMFEYELEAIIEYVFKQRGSERLGFPSIVGSGPNSCILHYDTNRRQTQRGDLVVVDIGAEFGMYSADVTRTIPIIGKFTPPQKEIYNLVLEAQEAGIDAAVVGADFRAPHRAATRKIVEGLVRLGLLNGDIDALIKDGSYRAVFMHGTSHYLGLDVHDVGDSGPLQPDEVITVEPGIYISETTGKELNVPKKYWNIGVRIEDDVLITPKGPEILSKNTPRRPEEIEKMMASSNTVR